jgi:signal peptidase II
LDCAHTCSIAGNPIVIWLEPVLVATAVLATDQASKALVLRAGPHQPGGDRRFVRVRRGLNRHGVLGSLSPPTLLALWGTTLVLVTLALCDEAIHRSILGPVGFGAAVGGATGNMLDRVRLGAIVDFIAIGWWPAFNLADVAIVSGAGLALLSML